MRGKIRGLWMWFKLKGLISTKKLELLNNVNKLKTTEITLHASKKLATIDINLLT